MEHHYRPLKGERPWDSGVLMMLFSTSFMIGMCVIIAATALLFPNAWEVNTPPPPVYVILVITVVVLLPVSFEAIQRILGVTAYSVDDAGIVVHHRIGETRIPFNAVAYARKDFLYSYVPRYAKNSRGSLTFVLADEKCGVEETGNLFGPYFSTSDGECVALKLKKDDSRIALTPESADEMLNGLKGYVASGRGADFEKGMRDAADLKLDKAQLTDIIGKIDKNRIRMIEGVPEDSLGRLESDLDYRAGYVDGLKSLLSEINVSEERREVHKLDELEEKMRL